MPMIAFDPNITVCLHVNAIKHNVVKIITFSQSEFVVKNILNSLRSGLALQHIGYLSSNPPHIYALFFPQSTTSTSNPKRTVETLESFNPKTPRRETPITWKGFIISTCDNRLFPVNEMSYSPCVMYLEDGVCSFGDKCKYEHLVFPKDYNKSDKLTTKTGLKIPNVLVGNQRPKNP